MRQSVRVNPDWHEVTLKPQNSVLTSEQKKHLKELPRLWQSVLPDSVGTGRSPSNLQTTGAPDLSDNPLISAIVGANKVIADDLARRNDFSILPNLQNNLELAKNLTVANIKKLEEQFRKQEVANPLEPQRGLSCGIHSINNLFSRPGLVSALQVLEVYKILENSGLNTDASERKMNVSEIDGVLNSKDDARAHGLISDAMNGVEFNVVSTLLNSWVVPAANSANIPVGEFQNMQLAALVDTACFGKRMIAHRPGHYFAVAPVPSKETNGGNTPMWEVRDSIGPQRIQLSGFDALKKYLEDQKVGNVLLESQVNS